uniref:G-protein coupled receptors family 1 profile domain-containing protein n=1 Tax=Chrysemys picta bellii TaxID=8478 RepID=A0A8C3HM89_CHRPI
MQPAAAYHWAGPAAGDAPFGSWAGRCPLTPAPMDLYLGFVILEGLLALAVVATNLLVCAALCLHRELRSVTNCLVACLALADLGVGALAIPFSVVLSLELTLCFYTCLFLACFPLVTTQFSILLLLASVEPTRALNRLSPCSYAMYVRRGRVLGAVGLCWLLSLLIGLSPMMGWNRQGRYMERNWNRTLAVSYHLGRCSFTSVFAPEYLVYFVFFACTLLPLGALLGIYANLFRLVRGHFLAQPLRAAKRGELPMARTLLLLLGIFCLCWIPLHVIYCVRLLCPGCRSYAALDRLAVLLSHLNSLANPLVYAMRKKDFGRTLRSVCLRYVPCCSRAKVHPQGRSGRR